MQQAITETFTTILGSSKIQSIVPILTDNDKVEHGYKVVFEGDDGWIDGNPYNHTQLCRLLTIVPFLVLERMDIGGVGATQLEPSTVNLQDPWHRDIFLPWEDSPIVMKMPRGKKRDIPTYFSLEESVRSSIEKYIKKRGPNTALQALMQFQNPFVIAEVQKLLRELIQVRDRDFTEITFQSIPPLQKYVQKWNNADFVTSLLVRNSACSPILHARPEARPQVKKEKCNPLTVFRMEKMLESSEMF